MELNRNQVWNNGPLAAGRSLDDSRQILSPPKAAKIDDFSHAIQPWENLEQRHRERTGDLLPKDMRLAILFSMCPTDLERELTAQQHLFPDYAQMRAHIVTVINSRTRGPAPMMMGNTNDEASNSDASSDEFVESEDGELYYERSETAKRFSPKLGTIRAKAIRKVEAKVEPTKNVSVVDALATSERIAEPRLISMEDPRNLHPKEKELEVARKKIPKHHNMCHWGSSIWGLLRCCQTTVTPKRMVMLMNS